MSNQSSGRRRDGDGKRTSTYSQNMESDSLFVGRESFKDEVILRKKFLTKLVPVGDSLEVLDFMEVPSYAKR